MSDTPKQPESELSVEDTLHIVLSKYRWACNDIRTSGQPTLDDYEKAGDISITEIKKLIISEGRKMAEYAIGKDNPKGYYNRNRLIELEQRKEQRTRLDTYIKENYGQ